LATFQDAVERVGLEGSCPGLGWCESYVRLLHLPDCEVMLSESLNLILILYFFARQVYKIF